MTSLQGGGFIYLKPILSFNRCETVFFTNTVLANIENIFRLLTDEYYPI